MSNLRGLLLVLALLTIVVFIPTIKRVLLSYTVPALTVFSSERAILVKRACKKYNTRWSHLSNAERQIAAQHIIVNDEHKVLYCYVPKVACTNWKRVFNVLDGKAKDTVSIQRVNYAFVLLDRFSDAEVERRLKDYDKFMFVREPLDRLISAYRDKLTGGNKDYNKNYIQKMIANFRHKNELQSAGSKGQGVSLTEFFQHLSITDPLNMDEHWMPAYQLCQPCAVEYNFIGSFENLQRDSQEILRRLGLDNLVQFPSKQIEYTERKKSQSTEEVLSKVPKLLLKRILRVYSKDYELFWWYKRPTVRNKK